MTAMKPGKTTWGTAVSILSMALLLQFHATGSQAESFYEYPDYNDYPEEPVGEYPHQTASLMGISAVIGGVMVSGIENDKKMHFGGSIILGAGSEYILRQLNYEPDNRWRRIAVATGMGLIPGIAKESIDSKFDFGDILADLAGSFTGALLADLLQGPVPPQLHVTLNKDRIGLAFSHNF